MSLLRTFIALEIPTHIQAAIHHETATLRQALGGSLVRWVPSENVHLTLKFLGEISPSNLEVLTQMLGVEATQHPSFEMEIGELGVFPSLRRPRVIWIGIQAPAVLESLQRGIEAAASRLGYESEARPFSPHLTIGRLKQHVNGADLQAVRAGLEGTGVGALGRVSVDSVHLFRSDLKPSGAVYTRLFSAPLASA
jgi:2'-5' RNA ligase